MRIKGILYSDRFAKKMKRIPLGLAMIIDQREALFRKDCFDPRLKTHKLHGVMAGFYSFSVTHSHRIVFEMLSDGSVVFIDIGDHSIYQ